MMNLGIKVNNLQKNFGDLEALKNVSLEISEPGLYGLIGPNAAGKTTLFKCITGLLIPTSGEVFVNGQVVNNKHLGFRNSIGFLPEDSGLYDKLTAKQFLHITAGLHGIDKKTRGNKIKEIINFVGIKYSPNKIVKYLSTGQRRILLLASILIHDPEIIILDESLSGLDPINRENISKVMKKIAQEKIVIFSSHILSDIWRLCERIFVLREGELIEDERPERILSQLSDNTFFISSTSDLIQIEDFLKKNNLIEIVRLIGDKIIFKIDNPEELNNILKETIIQYKVTSFGPNLPDLDQIFARMVNAS